MRRELAGRWPALGLATAALAALALSVAGCGSSGGETSGSAGHPGTGASRQAAGGPLALSHMKVLTKLTRAQLCSVLSRSAATRILGAVTQAPVYTDQPGVVVACEWTRQGASKLGSKQLYASVSALASWTVAQAVDKPLHARHVTVSGHPALVFTRRAGASSAEVDVALGGDHDPVAEFRAPTVPVALALARAATPHILAYG